MIMFTQFEEGKFLSDTHDDTKSGIKSDDKSAMPPLSSEEEMDAMSSGNESDAEHMSTEMLVDICDCSQSHPSINRIQVRYKIRVCIKRSQEEWKAALLSTQNMGKGLHKLFQAVVNVISQSLPNLGEPR